MRDITLHINGTDHALQIEDNWTLLYVLREVLNLTGTKYGCGTNDCGACKVLVDGVPKNSCVLLARNLEGADILTIEGVYCTPGMVMTSLALLANNPDPSEDEILTALEGNLCRCTGYKKIVEAVQLTARRMREDDGAQQG